MGRAAAGHDRTPGGPAEERGADDEHPPVPVADPPGGADGERARRQEDRGTEPENALDARDGDERQRAERRGELEHPGVADEAAGEQERVAPDVAPHTMSIRRSPSA